MKTWCIVAAAPLMLAACGQNESMRANPAMLHDLEVSKPVPKAASQAQIAYAYRYSYRLRGDAIDAVQAEHVALCDKLGRKRCRIATLERSGGDGEFTNASLTLFVDARIARQFGTALDEAVEGAGGEGVDRGVTGEDLSKAMIDTGARIAAKQALADRLLQLIRTRSGSVADLVAAERAFADAQEELDAARTSMAEMQARVAMSQIEISYRARDAAGNGLLRPIRDAFASIGDLLGNSIAALLTVAVVLVPWLLLLFGLRWLMRRFGWRICWPTRGRRPID